jgi:hypothetical protein
MKELSPSEKISYAEKLEIFIRYLNSFTLLSTKRLCLNHVCLSIPVENTYHFFDFPYNKLADSFNRELNNIGGELYKTNEFVFSLFEEKQAQNINGYILYKYHYNKDVRLSGIKTNLTDLPLKDKNIYKYLSIIHYAIHFDTTNIRYDTNVILEEEAENSSNILLTLVKKVDFQGIKSTERNSIVCSFEFEDENDINISQEYIDQLYDRIVYALENYFDSPVLAKLLAERRKSLFRSLHHTWNNVHLPLKFQDLKDSIEGNDSISISSSFSDLYSSFNYFHLLLYSTFKEVYTDAGDNDYMISFYKLESAKIKDIIQYFVKEANRFQIINFNIDDEDKEFISVDFIPYKYNKLHDVITVLFNLWINASQVADRFDKSVEIKLYNNNGRPAVSFKNQGEIPLKYARYLQAQEILSYPYDLSVDSGKYKGLEIIKDILHKEQNSDWNIDIDTPIIGMIKYTVISITF